MKCGNEKIRFVYIVSHPEINEKFIVGCICTEKITGEHWIQELQNRARRRINWANKNLKFSKNGNHYFKLDGKLLVIFRDKKNLKYKVTTDGTSDRHSFQT